VVVVAGAVQFRDQPGHPGRGIGLLGHGTVLS
jgi:hypothetical protein